MFNALLMSVVRFAETVVNYSLGAALVAICIFCIAAARCSIKGDTFNNNAPGSRAVSRTGTQSVTLAMVMTVALGCAIVGMAFWAR